MATACPLLGLTLLFISASLAAESGEKALTIAKGETRSNDLLLLGFLAVGILWLGRKVLRLLRVSDPPSHPYIHYRSYSSETALPAPLDRIFDLLSNHGR